MAGFNELGVRKCALRPIHRGDTGWKEGWRAYGGHHVTDTRDGQEGAAECDEIRVKDTECAFIGGKSLQYEVFSSRAAGRSGTAQILVSDKNLSG